MQFEMWGLCKKAAGDKDDVEYRGWKHFVEDLSLNIFVIVFGKGEIENARYVYSFTYVRKCSLRIEPTCMKNHHTTFLSAMSERIPGKLVRKNYSFAIAVDNKEMAFVARTDKSSADIQANISDATISDMDSFSLQLERSGTDDEIVTVFMTAKDGIASPSEIAEKFGRAIFKQ